MRWGMGRYNVIPRRERYYIRVRSIVTKIWKYNCFSIGRCGDWIIFHVDPVMNLLWLESKTNITHFILYLQWRLFIYFSTSRPAITILGSNSKNSPRTTIHDNFKTNCQNVPLRTSISNPHVQNILLSGHKSRRPDENVFRLEISHFSCRSSKSFSDTNHLPCIPAFKLYFPSTVLQFFSSVFPRKYSGRVHKAENLLKPENHAYPFSRLNDAYRLDIFHEAMERG